MIRLLPLFSALLLLIGFALPAQAAEPIPDAKLRAYLEQIYAGTATPDRISRWTVPIRYSIYSKLSGVVGLYIRDRMAEIAAATGLDIKEDVTDGDATNLMFVLEQNIDPYLQNPSILPLFAEKGETPEETFANTKAFFATQTLMQGWAIETLGVRRHVAFVNMQKIGRGDNIQPWLLRMIFTALTGTRMSDELPSVNNSADRLAFQPLDIALLKALYSDSRKIPHLIRLKDIETPFIADIQRYYKQ